MEVPEAIQEATESEEKYLAMAPDIITFVFQNQEEGSKELNETVKKIILGTDAGVIKKYFAVALMRDTILNTQIQSLLDIFSKSKNYSSILTACKLQQVESVFGDMQGDEETKKSCHNLCVQFVFELNQFFGTNPDGTESNFQKYYKKVVEKGVDFTEIAKSEGLGQPFVAMADPEDEQADEPQDQQPNPARSQHQTPVPQEPFELEVHNKIKAINQELENAGLMVQEINQYNQDSEGIIEYVEQFIIEIEQRADLQSVLDKVYSSNLPPNKQDALSETLWKANERLEEHKKLISNFRKSPTPNNFATMKSAMLKLHSSVETPAPVVSASQMQDKPNPKPQEHMTPMPPGLDKESENFKTGVYQKLSNLQPKLKSLVERLQSHPNYNSQTNDLVKDIYTHTSDLDKKLDSDGTLQKVYEVNISEEDRNDIIEKLFMGSSQIQQHQKPLEDFMKSPSPNAYHVLCSTLFPIHGLRVPPKPEEEIKRPAPVPQSIHNSNFQKDPVNSMAPQNRPGSLQDAHQTSAFQGPVPPSPHEQSSGILGRASGLEKSLVGQVPLQPAVQSIHSQHHPDLVHKPDHSHHSGVHQSPGQPKHISAIHEVPNPSMVKPNPSTPPQKPEAVKPHKEALRDSVPADLEHMGFSSPGKGDDLASLGRMGSAGFAENPPSTIQHLPGNGSAVKGSGLDSIKAKPSLDPIQSDRREASNLLPLLATPPETPVVKPKGSLPKELSEKLDRLLSDPPAPLIELSNPALNRSHASNHRRQGNVSIRNKSNDSIVGADRSRSNINMPALQTTAVVANPAVIPNKTRAMAAILPSDEDIPDERNVQRTSDIGSSMQMQKLGSGRPAPSPEAAFQPPALVQQPPEVKMRPPHPIAAIKPSHLMFEDPHVQQRPDLMSHTVPRDAELSKLISTNNAGHGSVGVNPALAPSASKPPVHRDEVADRESRADLIRSRMGFNGDESALDPAEKSRLLEDRLSKLTEEKNLLTRKLRDAEILADPKLTGNEGLKRIVELENQLDEMRRKVEILQRPPRGRIGANPSDDPRNRSADPHKSQHNSQMDPDVKNSMHIMSNELERLRKENQVLKDSMMVRPFQSSPADETTKLRSELEKESRNSAELTAKVMQLQASLNSANLNTNRELEMLKMENQSMRNQIERETIAMRPKAEEVFASKELPRVQTELNGAKVTIAKLESEIEHFQRQKEDLAKRLAYMTSAKQQAEQELENERHHRSENQGYVPNQPRAVVDRAGYYKSRADLHSYVQEAVTNEQPKYFSEHRPADSASMGKYLMIPNQYSTAVSDQPAVNKVDRIVSRGPTSFRRLDKYLPGKVTTLFEDRDVQIHFKRQNTVLVKKKIFVRTLIEVLNKNPSASFEGTTLSLKPVGSGSSSGLKILIKNELKNLVIAPGEKAVIDVAFSLNSVSLSPPEVTLSYSSNVSQTQHKVKTSVPLSSGNFIVFDPLRTQGVTGMPEVELRGMGSLLKLDSDLFWVASSSTPDTLKHDRTGLNNVTSDTMNTNSRSELELLLPGIAQLPRGQYLDGNNFAEVWGGGFSYSGLDYQGILLIFFAPDSSAKVRILWDPSYLSQEYSREVLQAVVDMIKLDQ